MQEHLQVPLDKKYKWLEIVENLSVIGSIGGAIASVVSQQVAFASIPLSVSVMLNLVNRRRLLDAINQSNQTAITQVIQENVSTQNQLENLNGQLVELDRLTTKKHSETQSEFSLLNERLQQLATNFSQERQTNHQAIAQLKQQNIETQAELGMRTGQLEQLQQLTNELAQVQNNSILNQQAKITKTVDCLQEIETYTQIIRLNPIAANAFFNRGLNYQHLGILEAAIADYTEAIRLNPHYAEAYQSRGLAYADLRNRKAAVNDLREAARLFFENGNIDKYQIARDLSKKFYDLDTSTVTDTFSEIATKSLFSTCN